MSDLVCARLKKIVNLQDNIQAVELHYQKKRRRVDNFNDYSLPIVF